MKRWNLVTTAAIILFLSASALASSVGDPGGIIRSGSNYDEEAIIGPGLTLTFDNNPVTSFNPFDAGFCYWVEGGQQCNFENRSGLTILSVNQIFAAAPSSFTGPNTLSCVNEINPEGGCDAVGNTLGFDGLGIPSANANKDLGDGDPDFNILYFGFDDNHPLAEIASTSFVPEPASLWLLLGGALGLGLEWKRRRLARTR